MLTRGTNPASISRQAARLHYVGCRCKGLRRENRRGMILKIRVCDHVGACARHPDLLRQVFSYESYEPPLETRKIVVLNMVIARRSWIAWSRRRSMKMR